MPIRSLWQVDWQENAPDGVWNILCPGPSLERTAELVHAGAPTIAVNQALRAPVPVSFWCSWDAPSDSVHRNAWTHRGVGGAFHDVRTVITSGALVDRWHQWFARLSGGDPLIVGQRRGDPTPSPWKIGGLDTGPSWLLAARVAIQRGGARRLRMFGLDLEGEGYAYGAPDNQRRSPEDWEGRWVSERVILERLRELLDELGVVFERVAPNHSASLDSE